MYYNIVRRKNDIFINFSKPLQWTFKLPDEWDTVVEIELKDKL